MVGSSCDETYPFGPVQLYVAPATVVDISKIASPLQTGELLEATGAVGFGLTVTLADPAVLVHPLTVTNN